MQRKELVIPRNEITPYMTLSPLEVYLLHLRISTTTIQWNDASTVIFQCSRDSIFKFNVQKKIKRMWTIGIYL